MNLLSHDLQNIKLISGSSHPNLAKHISKNLKIPLTSCILDKFSNTEIRVEINENIRNKDIFIIQTGSHNSTNSINDILIETLVMIDACKRSMTKSINLIMPNFPYARQDKKNESRSPISAKLIANLLEKSGIDRIVVMDLHAQQIQGFFDIPVDNIYSVNLVVNYLENSLFNNFTLQERLNNFVVVSPDAGAIKRTLKFAKYMKLTSVFMHKQRNYTISNTIDDMILVGHHNLIKNKTALICDDICDTAGTLLKCCDVLKQYGVNDIYCIITHGIFSGPALERINNNNNITQIIVSDSISQHYNSINCSKIKTYSISDLMSSVIIKIITGDSISQLF